jgi:hypothetical protein
MSLAAARGGAIDAFDADSIGIDGAASSSMGALSGADAGLNLGDGDGDGDGTPGP